MKLRAALLGFTSLSPIAYADTLTLRSNIEINGLVQYENDAFALAAKYKTGGRTYTFDRREVKSVEINNRAYNPGEPPTSVSTFDPKVASAKDAAQQLSAGKGHTAIKKRESGSSKVSVFVTGKDDLATSDVIWLTDKTKLVGRVLLIQNEHVTIQTRSGQKQVEEQKVVSVLVAPD